MLVSIPTSYKAHLVDGASNSLYELHCVKDVVDNDKLNCEKFWPLSLSQIQISDR